MAQNPYIMEAISSILRRKGRPFNIVAPDTPVSTALNQMCSEGVDYLIVMENGTFLGVLTEHEVVSKIAGLREGLEKAAVRDFMNVRLPVVNESDSAVFAMQLMDECNTKYTAVYNGRSFKGVVSVYDVLKEALRKRKDFFEEKEEEVHAYPWHY